MSSPSEAEVEIGVVPGDLVAGKYRIDAVLRVGGMGAVVAAHHIELDTKVAIKVLLPDVRRHPEALTRFAREARAAAKITSEHVARVLDVGNLDSGAPYIVMEFLDGHDLSEWGQRWGSLPIDQAVCFVLQAAVAIAEAHVLGIVHRDLKPANLFCVRDADGQFTIKVLDFGVSKLTHPLRVSEPIGAVTKTTTVMGSPLYMSPEQVENCKDVDERTDIWALGIILFELLAGTVPFPGETLGEIAVKIATKPSLRLKTFRPDAPPGLQEVIDRCLEKDRKLRYPTVLALAKALAPFSPQNAKIFVDRIARIARADVDESPDSRGVVEESDAFAESISPWSGTQRPATMRRRALAVVLLVMGVVTAVAAFAVVHARHVPAEASALDLAAPSSAPMPLRATAPAGTAESLGTAVRIAPITSSPVVASRPSWVAAEKTPAAKARPGAKPPGSAEASKLEPLPPPALAQPAQTAPSLKALPEAPPPSASAAQGTRTGPEPPGTAAAPRPDCDPPYTLDNEGQKHFKAECYP